MKTWIAFTFLIIRSIYGLALVEKDIDGKCPIEVVFSSHSLNRISVEDGRIEKVIGDDSLFEINIDSMTGQAFVFVLGEFPQSGTTLTVITAGGYLQDLHVKSSDKASELVILKEPDGVSEQLTIHPLDFQVNSIDFLNVLISGDVPAGYGYSDLQLAKPIQLPKELQSFPIKVIEGPFDRITLLKIVNRSKKRIVLKPSTLRSNEDLWVFLSTQDLKGREEALCIIASKKEGGRG